MNLNFARFADAVNSRRACRAATQAQHGATQANTEQNRAAAASAANTRVALARQHAERAQLNAGHKVEQSPCDTCAVGAKEHRLKEVDSRFVRSSLDPDPAHHAG